VKRLFKGCLSIFLLIVFGPWIFLFFASFFNGYVEVEEDLAASVLLQNPPPAWEEARTLRVVTFNIQDLPVVAKYKHYPERMRAIAVKLSTYDPDVVGFQESFTGKHRQILMDELRAGTRLQYFQYFGSGWGGSGLLTASAYPIVESQFHRFEDSNPWYFIWEGDWWAGKGMSLDRLDLGDGAYLDVYNTHAQAGYGRAANDVVRFNQMSAAADFIQRSRLPGTPAFVVGDLNCRRGEPDYEALINGANLIRTMVIESRIDHVLAALDPAYTYEVTRTIEIEQRVRVNNKEFGLSDHNGYLSEVIVSPVQTQSVQEDQSDDVPLTTETDAAPEDLPAS